MTHRLIPFLEQAIALLKRQTPAHYRRLCQTLDGRQLRVCTERDHFDVGEHGGKLVIRGLVVERPCVSVTLDEALLLELVDGRQDLLTALDASRLELTGSVDDLLVLESCLHIFINGAVRAPAMPGLLANYRLSKENVA